MFIDDCKMRARASDRTGGPTDYEDAVFALCTRTLATVAVAIAFRVNAHAQACMLCLHRLARLQLATKSGGATATVTAAQHRPQNTARLSDRGLVISKSSSSAHAIPVRSFVPSFVRALDEAPEYSIISHSSVCCEHFAHVDRVKCILFVLIG